MPKAPSVIPERFSDGSVVQIKCLLLVGNHNVVSKGVVPSINWKAALPFTVTGDPEISSMASGSSSFR